MKVPVIPNHEERRENKMLWSVNRIKFNREVKMIFFRPYGIGEVVMDSL